MVLFQYAVVASVLHDERSKESLFEKFERALGAQGGEVQSLGTRMLRERAAATPLFIFVLTGGTEADAMRIISAERMIERGAPIVLLAHQSHNSLPASLEILAKVRQLGGSGSILQADAADAFDAAALGDIAAVANTMQRLKTVRIGVVGKPSDWLIASSQGADAARRAWGVELAEIPFEELVAEIEKIRAQAADDREASSMKGKAEFFNESSDSDMRKSMDILHALRTIAERDNIGALTLRCFDLVLQDHSTGCLALSALADEGIDAGCEGDIPSIIALRWMRLLTGQTGWMANPSKITVSSDKSGAELLIAHCTAPRSILSRYGLRSHFESGLGVAIAGIIPDGEVTLVRIGGTELDRVWFSAARVVASPRKEGLCRTQAVLAIAPEKAEELLTAPLGNHLVMVRGDWSSRIEAFIRLNTALAR